MEKISILFRIDLRSLALARIVIGLTFLGDMFFRLWDVNSFYSDNGILSRAELLSSFAITEKMSLLLTGGSTFYVYCFFVAAIFFGMLYTLGMKTRLSSFVCWVVYLSIHARFPLINHGGDNLMRLLFLYSTLLPMNAKYSIDKAIAENEDENSISSPASFLWVLQILCIYFFTVFYKNHPDWMSNFNAAYYSLELDAFTTFFGKMFSGQVLLLKLFTITTVVFELAGPILLLVPFKQTLMRYISVAMLFSLHIGIGMFYKLGTFPTACIALWCAMIPSHFWSYLREKVKLRGEGLVLYYDKDCGFCRKFCLIVKEFLFLPSLKVQSSVDDQKIHNVIDSEKSWLLVDEKKQYLRFEVIQRFLNFKKGKELGNFLYNFVSKRRYLLGVLFNKIGVSKIILRSKFSSLCAVALSVLVFSWNLEGTWIIKSFDLKSPVTDVVFALQLNQQWDMFAPSPMKSDGWYTVVGKMKDGSQFDVFHHEQVNFEKPYNVSARYKNTQWRKFLLSLWQAKNNSYRSYFGRWLCRQWNEQNMLKVESIDFYYNLENTKLDPREMKVSKEFMFNSSCL